MAALELRVVDTRIPGPAPVGTASVFEAVANAVACDASPTTSPETPGAPPPCVSLAGEWQRSLDRETWQRVFVPDNFGLEPSLSAYFDAVFYRRRLPRLDTPYQRVVFDAVDYLCNAWLDDAELGSHEGYFAPFAFDVTGRVRDGSRLLVHVQDPFEDLDPSLPFLLHAKEAIKGVLKYHDSRPGGLPGSHTPGWTPTEGQSMTTGGITGDVRLEGTGALRIDAIFVTPLDAADGLIHVAVVCTNLSRAPIDAVIDLEIAAHRGAVAIVAPPGSCRFDAETTLPDAALWWPASHMDLGGPTLYALRARAVVDGRTSDERATRFGLRTAEVSGDPKRLVVNGRPVFVQAVNYIPRQHFADVDLDFYRRDMRLCADAHVNSLGVHGHVQCGACYEATDEAGMLVFQDFALQWHYDAGAKTNPGFVDNACRQIADMAYTLYNHPSVVYWACHNEPTALFIPGMPPDPARDPDNQVLDEALEHAIRKVETHRHVHRASGIGDDLHLYDGSLNGGVVYDVRKYKTWFVSEYGFWTAGPQSARWGDLRWPPDEEQLREWFARLSFGAATFGFAGLPERYPSLDAFRRATEAYGAFLAKYQTEWFRMHRGDPFNAYRWHFFVDWWGWAGGGLCDVDRKPKATYRAYAAASRPVLVATSLPHTVFPPGVPLEFPMVAVNETRRALDLEVTWRWCAAPRSIVIGSDDDVAKRYSMIAPAERSMVAVPYGEPEGQPISSGKLTVHVEPEATASAGVVGVSAPDRHQAAATLVLEWGDGEANWFHVLAADAGWFPGPGAFIVGAGTSTRLGEE